MFLSEAADYVLKLQRALKEANPKLAASLDIPTDGETCNEVSSDDARKKDDNAAPSMIQTSETVHRRLSNDSSAAQETDSLQPATPLASAATLVETERCGSVSSKDTFLKHEPASSTSTSDREDETREASPHPKPLTPSTSSSSLSQFAVDSGKGLGAVQTSSHSTVTRPIPVVAVRRSYGSAFLPVASPLYKTPAQSALADDSISNKRMRT